MTPDVQPADVSIRDLEARWGLSRNGLKARARALGVELRRVSSTLTVWPGEWVELGDRLHEHIAAGRPMGTFPGLAPGSDSTAPSAPAPAESPPEGLAVAGAAQLAALVSALQQPSAAPSADPLQRARGLAEAADHALVLANEDLGALLGHGVTSWRDGHQAYGYAFRRHQQGRQVLWTVQRAIAQAPGIASTAPSVPAALPPAVTEPPAQRRPGFAVDATATVLSRLELPHWLTPSYRH